MSQVEKSRERVALYKSVRVVHVCVSIVKSSKISLLATCDLRLGTWFVRSLAPGSITRGTSDERLSTSDLV